MHRILEVLGAPRLRQLAGPRPRSDCLWQQQGIPPLRDRSSPPRLSSATDSGSKERAVIRRWRKVVAVPVLGGPHREYL
jgi:hypothetical protein